MVQLGFFTGTYLSCWQNILQCSSILRSNIIELQTAFLSKLYNKDRCYSFEDTFCRLTNFPSASIYDAFGIYQINVSSSSQIYFFGKFHYLSALCFDDLILQVLLLCTKIQYLYPNIICISFYDINDICQFSVIFQATYIQ